MEQDVFKSDAVSGLQDLIPGMPLTRFRLLPIREQISHLAGIVLKAHRAGDVRVRLLLSAFWPAAVEGVDPMALPVSPDDARLAVARSFGYLDWPMAKRDGAGIASLTFEAAIDAMQSGNAFALRMAISQKKTLITARSSYAHRASLLHYLTGHGVECHRRVVPLNAPEMARMLLDAGANPEVTMAGCCGAVTPAHLALASPVARAAGVSAELARVLSAHHRV